jgi:general stress protein 26
MRFLKFILCVVSVAFTQHALATTQTWDQASTKAKSLATELLSDAKASVTEKSGQKTMKHIGVSAQTVGNQSSLSRDNMGVSGSLSANFKFTVNNLCLSDQHRTALHGVYFIIPCDKNKQINNTQSHISALICVEQNELNSADIKNVNCNKSNNYQDINIPVNNSSITKNGYRVSARCKNNRCAATVTQKGQTVTNADTINQQAKRAASKSDMSQTITSGYLGKNGYSSHQAYMKSFTGDGENNIFSKCNKKTKAVLTSGVYYNCQGNENDTFDSKGNTCITQKICQNWGVVNHKEVSYKNCTLTAKNKDKICHKVTKVSIKSKVIPPNNKSFSGSFTGYPNGSTYGGDSDAYFTYPYTGVVKSFSYSITGSGSFSFWVGEFIISIDGIIRSVYTKNDPYGLFYFADSNRHLNTPVTQNKQAHFYMDGTGSSTFPMQYIVKYNGIIEIPQKTEKYPVVTTEIQC